ncbi:MAG: serine hydrolase, partial [bacterium]|nr:serine hydrolase [bacterium]
GKYFSRSSIGHLGFTGCSVWIDPEQDFQMILLTNRVHPSRENDQIKQFRSQVHDIAYETLLQKN